MTHRLRAVLAATSVVITVLGAAGCGSDDDTADTTTPASVIGGDVLPPVTVDIAALNDTTVEVSVGGVVDITGDDTTYKDWRAEITDPTIVSFTPGHDEGSTKFNPGLVGLKVGQTDVTLGNPTSGDTVKFSVKVVAA